MRAQLFFAAISLLYVQLLQSADDCKRYVDRVGEKLIQALIVADPAADNIQYDAWRSGLSTEFVAAYIPLAKRINKYLHFFCKHLDEEQNKILKLHSKYYHISKPSILFNNYRYFCCLGTAGTPQKRYVLFGQGKLLHAREYECASANVNSFSINYHDVHSNSNTDTIFNMQSLFAKNSSILIMPNKEKLFTVSFKNYNGYNPSLFKKTFTQLIQEIFKLSANHLFWYPRFEKNGISLTHDSISDLTIDLHNTYIAPLCKNLTVLNGIDDYFYDTFKNNHCTCSSGKVDSACQTACQDYGNLLEYESVTNLKHYILRTFVQCHILREIKDSVDQANTTLKFYTNPLGMVIADNGTKKQIIEPNEHDTRSDVATLDIEVLQSSAQLCAEDWRRKGTALFSVQKTAQQKILRFSSKFCDGKSLIPLYCNKINIELDETIDDIYVFKKEQRHILYYCVSLRKQAVDVNGRFLLFNPDFKAHEIRHYSCQSAESIKNGFNFLLHQGHPSNTTYSNINCFITAPKQTIAELMSYVRTSMVIQKYNSGFISATEPFKDWNHSSGNVPFLATNKTIEFPKNYYDQTGKYYELKKHSFPIGTNEIITDTEYVILDKKILLLIATSNQKHEMGTLRFFNTHDNSTSMPSFTGQALNELKNCFDLVRSKNKQAYSCCVNAPQRIIQNFLEYIRSFRSNNEWSSPLEPGSKEMPLTTIGYFNIDNLSRQILQKNTCYIKPIGLFERVLWGLDIRHANDDNLSVAPLLFCLPIGLVGMLIEHYSVLALVPFATVLVTDDTFPSLKKYIRPAQLSTLAVFAYFGKKIFTGLFPQICVASLPLLNLGLHIYDAHKRHPTFDIPFEDLHNSLPIRFHRMLKKIAPRLYEVKKDAQ